MKTKKKRQTKAQKKANEQGDTYESMSLCANHIFTKESLTRMQTEYAICVKQFGLNRGVEGSKEPHVPMKLLRDKTAELKLATDQVIEQKNELEKAAVALEEKIENVDEKLTNREKKLKAEVEVENAKIIKANEKFVSARLQLDKKFEDNLVEIKNERAMLISSQNQHRKDVEDKRTEIENEKAQLTSSRQQLHKEIKDARIEIKNEHATVNSAQNKHRKEVEADNAKMIRGREILSEQEQKSKSFVDACFSPFLTDLDAAFSDMGPQGIKFLRDKLEEFDENIVKLQDDIPADITNHINKRLNRLRPKKPSLKF